MFDLRALKLVAFYFKITIWRKARLSYTLHLTVVHSGLWKSRTLILFQGTFSRDQSLVQLQLLLEIHFCVCPDGYKLSRIVAILKDLYSDFKCPQSAPETRKISYPGFPIEESFSCNP